MDKILSKGLTSFMLSMSIAHGIALQDQLDSIILIDDRAPEEKNASTKAVIGCNNDLKIKELSCAKERPTQEKNSTKLTTTPAKVETHPSQEEELKAIKSQLNAIMAKLSELTANSTQSVPEEVEKQIQTISAIQKEINKEGNTTKLPKKIKVIETKSDHDIIEVQSGESLSKYAQKYYNNPRDYANISRANPDKIDATLQVYVGDHLIIPTSKTYPYKTVEPPKQAAETNETALTPEPKPVRENNATLNSKTVTKEKDDPTQAIYVGQEGVEPQNEIQIETDPIETNSTEMNETTTKSLAWVETKVPAGFDIYQLAERYYGDKNEYQHIYRANKQIIGKDLLLTEGMKVKIPITQNFQDQPEFLNIQ